MKIKFWDDWKTHLTEKVLIFLSKERMFQSTCNYSKKCEHYLNSKAKFTNSNYV